MHIETLDDPDFRMPSAPDAANGVAWLRSQIARFSDGPDHERRRNLAVELLAGTSPDSLRRPGEPVSTLAASLGLPRSVSQDVRTVADSYHPHLPQSREADRAVERLARLCGGKDERAAALIQLLVQSDTATRAMIAGKRPPVPVTRRVAPTGETVEVDLSDAPFGRGPHACPGQAHALALVDGATAFARLHRQGDPLILPNAWDVSSALAFVDAGFAAVGTTSLGVAASNGLPDAAGSTLTPTLDLARRLAALPVPVTVDIEAGFGDALGDLVRELSELGVAGVNLEDGRGDRLESAIEQSRLIRAVKDVAPTLFVNARVDTHWLGIEQDSTLDRARRYTDAGADGIFVPGLCEPAGIEAVVTAVAAPLNVLPQLPVATLTELGVRRISTGSLPFRTAVRAAVDSAEAVRDGRPGPPADTYDRIEARTARHL